MPNSADIDVIRSALPFWKNITDVQQEMLLEGASILKYPKNSIVHSAESQCVGMLLVKAGSLRVYMLSEEGREITLYRINKGEVCVLSASCVLKEITFDVYIDAVDDCEVIQISSASISGIMKENIYAEAYAYKMAAERFSDVMWAMQQILFMSFDKRLAIFLLDEVNASHSDEIKMTHEQIAKLMGSAREVVTRMLKYFSSEGYVELSRGTVKIPDKNKLKNFL